MPFVDATEVVRRLGGTADWQQILRHSTSHSIRRALRLGGLRRVARGTYALPELPPVEQAAAAVRGLISHRSAADHWLMERLTKDDVVEVVVAPNAHPRPRKGVTLHYATVPAADDHNGVTSPLRTVLDCAASLAFAEALAIADSGLRRELITKDELLIAADQLRGRGRQRTRAVAEAADGRAANPFESALRAIVLSAGVSGFTPQLPIRTHERLAHVDLGDQELRIVLEADSFTFHSTREALARDCDRYTDLVRSGWLVLRFSWERVMFSPEWVTAAITDTRALRNPARRKSA